LPGGLSMSASGLISGTPTASGTYSVTLGATNAVGTGTATLVLTIAEAAPVITSAPAAGGAIAIPFTYQITATGSPTSFAAAGLPAGLSVSTSGHISGTPMASGTYSVRLSATNAGGTGTAAMALIVTMGEPAITSASTANGEVGAVFTYQMTASGSPTSFAATGLPAGLTINTASGAISGQPAASGTFSIALAATNAIGTGSATLTLTIAPAPVVTITASVREVPSVRGQRGRFTLTRTGGETDKNLTVFYTVRGSAVPGVDYVMLTGSKVIKAGKTKVNIPVVPSRVDLERMVTVKLVLQAPENDSYTLGKDRAAKVKIQPSK
jgi:PKD repeat protein